MPKPNAALPAGLVVALLALPAAAQTDAPGATPAPAVSSDGPATPVAAPALQSPALGPLGGRDTPVDTRSLAGGTLPGFATIAPGLGVAGISTPFDLGNRPYAIRPSIGVEALATNDKARTDGRSNVVTTIAPSLEAAVDTSRLFGTLRYTPALRLYGTRFNQIDVDQVGDGRLLAALVPGLFYVDMRGAASVVSVRPGVIPGSGQFVNRRETAQTYTAQVTPFLVQRFGSAASLQVGYSFQYSRQTGANSSQSIPDGLAEGYTAHRGFAVLRSGEDLGRLALQARIDGTRFVGNGIYDDAHRFVAALETRYAILRNVALLGEIGYESLRYAGTNPHSIQDPIWSVGLRLTPRPDSIVIIRYGRHSGFNSFSLNAGVALGVRTDLFATYKETLSTSLSEAQDLLATTTTDALGNPVDSQSGAPVVLIPPFLGLSDTLFRMRTGTVSLRYHWPRDVFTLSGTWQKQDPVTSASTAQSAVSSRGIYAAFNWRHEFSPRTTGMATVQYGRVSSAQFGQGTGNVYSAAATLAHELSDKLTASLQFAWTRDNARTTASETNQQFVFRAGLRRTF
ncbi:MAG TPA: TIGR03016 family PEP-CTERM system-associated outer membrane protein [Vineibacter sp.]|nr:TIGR03016 family PEP-CTERM system-associated outer membrane protein [Vineibacter sp.]